MKERKRFFIDRKFQVEAVLSVLFVFVAVFIISGYIHYTMALKLQDNALYMNTLQQAAGFAAGPHMITSLLAGLLISLVFTALLALYYSHRVAGPMHHLKQHLQNMIDGDFSRDLSFRKSDEFRSVATLVNRLQSRLKNEFS